MGMRQDCRHKARHGGEVWRGGRGGGQMETRSAGPSKHAAGTRACSREAARKWSQCLRLHLCLRELLRAGVDAALPAHGVRRHRLHAGSQAHPAGAGAAAACQPARCWVPRPGCSARWVLNRKSCNEGSLCASNSSVARGCRRGWRLRWDGSRVVARLDGGCHISHRLQATGTLTVHGAHWYGIGHACRGGGAGRPRGAARLQHAPIEAPGAHRASPPPHARHWSAGGACPHLRRTWPCAPRLRADCWGPARCPPPRRQWRPPPRPSGPAPP